MAQVLTVLLLLLSLPTDTLLESGKATKLRHQTPSTHEIKVVSYNIRWRSGDELKKIIKLLQQDPEVGGAAILGLQEVDRSKKRSGNSNTAKIIADDLGLHYVWAAPPTPRSTGGVRLKARVQARRLHRERAVRAVRPGQRRRFMPQVRPGDLRLGIRPKIDVVLGLPHRG